MREAVMTFRGEKTKTPTKRALAFDAATDVSEQCQFTFGAAFFTVTRHIQQASSRQSTRERLDPVALTLGGMGTSIFSDVRRRLDAAQSRANRLLTCASVS
jgi:hypothetical protein